MLPLLLLVSCVFAQSSGSASAKSASAQSGSSSGSATSTTPTTTKALGAGESIVTEPTFVSSLSSFVTTTYTTTTTPIAVSRPTDLPSSLYCTSATTDTGPFCLPKNGTQQISGKQYSVTWNPSYAPNCTDVYVALLYYNNSNAQQVTSTKTPNALGFWNYTVEKSWLNNQGSQYANFEILGYNCHGGNVQPQSGPVVELLSKAPVVNEPMSRDRTLGLSIGLPLALAAFIGTFLLVCWWNKSHRTVPKFGSKKGYTGRKQRAVKLQQMPASEYRDDPE